MVEIRRCIRTNRENIPLADIKAYEILTSSGIERIVKIESHQFLLIDDYIKDVCIEASVTTVNKDSNIKIENIPNYKIENKIWDGQSLADASLFWGIDPEEA